MSIKTNKRLLVIIAVLFFVIPVIISLVLLNLNHNSHEKLKTTTIANVNCQDVTQPCLATFNNNSFSFQLPDNARYLEAFPLVFNLDGEIASKPKSIQVDFRMANMEMGLNRYQLQQDRENLHRWQAKVVLPVCVSGRHDWQAHVSIQTADTEYSLVYNFEIKANAK